ncbi:MAG: hypothetical protein ACJ8GN_17835 [Longimicrobiaceae bacterium]
MYALLTLPRGIPVDPERPVPAADGGAEAPVGIIIRPGPVPAATRVRLREAIAMARG